MKHHHKREYVRLAASVLNRGGVSDPDQIGYANVIRWKAYGHGHRTQCLRPVYREFATGNSEPYDKIVKSRTFRHTTEIFARCRKCAPCLRARAAYWRATTAFEIERAPRAWFVTLTLRPEERFKAQATAHLRLAARGVSWISLDEDQKFRELESVTKGDIQRWLKRLRKAGYRFRYCLVSEAHKSGDPHWHLVMCETDPDTPLPYRALTSEWRLGFLHAKLVDDKHQAAVYVAKYLSKSARTRVRASIGWGSDGPRG